MVSKLESLDLLLQPEDAHRLANLCGQRDAHLHQIEQRLNVEISNRGGAFRLRGSLDAVNDACQILKDLYSLSAHQAITPQLVHLHLQEAARRTPAPGGAAVRLRRGAVRTHGPHQRAYVEAIRAHTLTFGVGPAGTGKTYLAVACAVEALERGQVQRLVLVRPAVEAGERLGFLPGDLAQKVDPYLRPMYDALYEMLGFEKVQKLIERNVIEVAPLAYMRGRTLNEAFIIMDEAQNTTVEQMKMFLTRIGFGSTAVVTGDVTQIDLPRQVESGLRHVLKVLHGVEEVAFVHFDAADVVRHPLVQRIVSAYEAHDGERDG
ncbi:MAG: PhoH family protein [Gammaproteobacteria bacterium]|nr:MAG: PhoH family protein [Gammaproteobacteria bacterium]